MAHPTILNDTPKRLIRAYRQNLIRHGIPVRRMILFGSYAKGTAKPWSDLDVCVVSEVFGKDSYEEMVRLRQLTTLIDPMIEPHPYHPNDLADPWDPLAAEIRRTGKLVDEGAAGS